MIPRAFTSACAARRLCDVCLHFMFNLSVLFSDSMSISYIGALGGGCGAFNRGTWMLARGTNGWGAECDFMEPTNLRDCGAAQKEDT